MAETPSHSPAAPRAPVGQCRQYDSLREKILGVVSLRRSFEPQEELCPQCHLRCRCHCWLLQRPVRSVPSELVGEPDRDVVHVLAGWGLLQEWAGEEVHRARLHGHVSRCRPHHREWRRAPDVPLLAALSARAWAVDAARGAQSCSSPVPTRTRAGPRAGAETPWRRRLSSRHTVHSCVATLCYVAVLRSNAVRSQCASFAPASYVLCRNSRNTSSGASARRTPSYGRRNCAKSGL